MAASAASTTSCSRAWPRASRRREARPPALPPRRDAASSMSSDKAVVYLHGFNSGAASMKGGQFEDAVQALADPPLVFRPQLPHRPDDAIAVVEGWMKSQSSRSISFVG